jgi:hypothetical protein
MARRKSGPALVRECKQGLDFVPSPIGHSSPHHCPTHCPHPGETNPLGAPLSIREVAALIGCSVWTVRQKYLPLGLPYFRVGSTGKLIFYKTQIIRWLVARQKGGTT